MNEWMNEWMNEPSVCWVVGHWLCYIELLCLHLPFRLLQIIGLPTSCLLIKTCRSSPQLLPVMQPLHNRPQVIIGPWLTINVTGIWFICFLLLFIAFIFILYSGLQTATKTVAFATKNINLRVKFLLRSPLATTFTCYKNLHVRTFFLIVLRSHLLLCSRIKLKIKRRYASKF